MVLLGVLIGAYSGMARSTAIRGNVNNLYFLKLLLQLADEEGMTLCRHG